MVTQQMSVTLKQAVITRRGTRTLGPINMTLAATGFTIVLGPNGSGKTSLLKVLHGVERLSSGLVTWSVANVDARQAQAYVFQKPIMLRRSVRQNLAYPLQLRKFHKSQINACVEDWAERINLQDALNRPATRLSGGEQQKLALARALIRDPKVLFLDEPCANLDGRSTREIETLLRDSCASGTRIIMATHDLGQARRLASEIVFLLEGEVREQSTAEDFFDAQQTVEARAFLNGDIIE